MGKILFAWELGSNFGHLSKQLPVARLLRQRGHEILFAAKDVGIAHQLLKGEGFGYLQSPFPRGLKRPVRKPVSFADILVEAGFGELDKLKALVDAWHNLFDIFRPDAVVTDHAPIAQIASHLASLPCLQMATGFESPPEVTPFPCFRPWLKITKDDLLKTEKIVLENINKACAQYNIPIFADLRRALKADITLLTAIPELDHYPGRKGGNYVGPLFTQEDGEDIQWHERCETPRIFAYLTPFPELRMVLNSLVNSGGDVIAVIPGIGDELRNSMNRDNLRICTSRAKLSRLLPEADLTINHANHGLASASLLTGVPMLTIPTTIEQLMMANNLERLGIGIGVTREKVAIDFATLLERILSDTTYREKSKKIAKKYASYDQGLVVERIANTIERLPHYKATEINEKNL